MKRLARNGKEIAKSPGYGYVCLRKHRLVRLVILLVLCWCICNFVIILKFSRSGSTDTASQTELSETERLQTLNITSVENYERTARTATNPIPVPKLPMSWQDSFAFIHSDGRSSVTDENAPLVMVFPYSTEENNISQELQENDKLALWKLSEFLGAMKGFDGATCLQKPLTRNLRENADRARQHDEEINSATNISLDSSWCRFLTRKWSVHIRNTGPVQKVQLFRNESLPVDFTREEMILLQSCSIVQGPFVIRKDVFNRIGGLLDSFGKVTLLEFFIRSKGQLNMAKLSNCAWTPEITRVDRGTLEGSNHFTEYGAFGNKHGILRIVTQSRIEWTTCVANWKLCEEKPYVKPRDLPSIAAPICCSVFLSQMLEDITWALTELGLEYRIIYGTLLGAIRSKAIIPWTCDVDIALTKATIDNASTFPAVEKFFGNKYYVGNSFMDMPRAHMLMAPYIEVDTAPFFDGPDDLEGNLLFSNDIEEAVEGMLPVSEGWRDRCYVDLYPAPSVWMNGSSFVTINNQQFVTVKEIDYELINWYGKNYREPILKGNWVGFSDQGTA